MLAEWQRVWRTGFAPHLPTEGLEKLAKALREDSPQLVQGSTTTPPPLECVAGWPVECGCAVAYCGAVTLGGFGTATVAAVNEFFADACHAADAALGEPAACRWFLNAWDNTPRAEMRRDLLPEVVRELDRRAGRECAA